MTMRHIHHYCSVTSLTINFYQVIFFSTYLSSVECVSFRVSILRHLKFIKFVSTIMWKAKFEINFFRHSQIAASNEPSTWAKKRKIKTTTTDCEALSVVHPPWFTLLSQFSSLIRDDFYLLFGRLFTVRCFIVKKRDIMLRKITRDAHWDSPMRSALWILFEKCFGNYIIWLQTVINISRTARLVNVPELFTSLHG